MLDLNTSFNLFVYDNNLLTILYEIVSAPTDTDTLN